MNADDSRNLTLEYYLRNLSV